MHPVNTHRQVPSKHHRINVTYANADRPKNKMNELTQYIQRTESRPQIIAVTETKPKNNRYPVFPAEYNIQDFVTYHKKVDNNKGRGIIIDVHESLLDR